MATSENSDSILLNQIVNQGVNIYGSREKIRSALIEYAKNYLNLQDTDIRKTSYLAYLIDQISILTANHIFYDSTIYREFFFTEAQFNDSVVNLAKWIGYSIPKATPSQVEVMFGIPLTFTRKRVTFNLSPYFYVRANKIPFIIKSKSLDSSNAGSMNINASELYDSDVHGSIINNSIINLKDSDGTYRPVFVSQDKTKAYFKLTFIQKEIILRTFEVPNDLSVNQFYNIDVTFDGQVSDIDVYIISPSYNQKLMTSGTSIDSINDASTFNPNEEIYDSAGSVCTWVKWEESINGIYTMSSRSNQYSWIGGYNKGKLMFGNGILGKQPPPNSIIAVRLHVTKGSGGNVVAKTINNGDPIYSNLTSDTVVNNNSGNTNGETIKYTIVNPESSSGGCDLLTIPEIKRNAIQNLSAKNRLVSDEDYNNIETIVGNDLPINDCHAILKRSDIKVNEIMAFTTLNYISDDVNEIVPTRNARLKLKNVPFDDEGKYVLMRNTIISNDTNCDNVGSDSYYTLYNLTLNKNNLTANYDYILQNVDGSAVKMYSRFKDNYYERFTYITGNSTNFGINTNRNSVLDNNYSLDVTFNVNHVPETNEGIDEDNMTAAEYFKWKIDRFQCKMITKWGNNDVYDCSAAYGYRYSIDEETGAYKSFSWTIGNYLNVPEGMQRFEFQLQCYGPYRDADGNVIATDGSIAIKAGEDYSDVEAAGRSLKILKMSWNTIRTYYTDIVIRRDLSSFMSSSISFSKSDECIDVNSDIVGRILSKDLYYNDSIIYLKDHVLTQEDYQDLFIKGISKIWVYDGNTWCYVHNVPVVLKSYYDSIIQSDDNTGSSNFELAVMQKLIAGIDFSNRKMLTDFVNIKFSDTYGPMYNLRYNNSQYEVESRYNNTPWWNSETQAIPTEIIKNDKYVIPENNESGIYYIVNNVIPFSEGVQKTNLLNDYIGYIALRIVNGDEDSGYTYTYQLIEPTRGMFVKVKDELDSQGFEKTLVWTGRSWKDVAEYTIPLKIKIKIEVNENVVSKSDDTVRKEIIDSLTSYFQDKIGIQKNIDRSEILKVCRSIKGITYAEIVSPEFDIRFDYEIKDLTQRQLIDFTPEYIGFRGRKSNEEDYGRSSIDIEIVRV